MELWTAAHTKTLLPALAVMVVLSAVLGKCLKNREEKVRIIPIQVMACLLVALEIGKQVLSLLRGYDLYHLPFHICSLFIFALPAMAFYRGRYKRQVYAVVASLCAAVFLLMLIYPNLIYPAWDIEAYFKNYFAFHTVTFHNLVMQAFLLIVVLRLHTPGKGEQKPLIWFTVGFCAVSATMAQLLKTNYANFYTCNVPVFEDIRIRLQGVIGVVPTQLLYILIVSVLTVLFMLMSYWFYRLMYRIVSKERTKAAL